jgi:hypothetical protein
MQKKLNAASHSSCAIHNIRVCLLITTDFVLQKTNFFLFYTITYIKNRHIELDQQIHYKFRQKRRVSTCFEFKRTGQYCFARWRLVTPATKSARWSWLGVAPAEFGRKIQKNIGPCTD